MPRDEILKVLRDEKATRERLIPLLSEYDWEGLPPNLRPGNPAALIENERQRIAHIERMISEIEASPDIL